VGGWALLAPAGGAAQARLGADGGTSYLEYRVDGSAGVERFSGLGASLGVALTAGRRAELRLAGAVGRLSASTAGALDRDLTQAMADVSVRLAPWFVATAGLAVRGFQTAAARQRWTTVHTGGEVRVPFLGRGVHGVLQAAYLPVVAVAGLDRPTLAFTAGAGVEYRLPLGALRVLYALERYTFAPPGGSRRPEQLSSLTVALRTRVVR
jgi:hypothetical protein